MSERAYSLELNKNISAKEAVELSKSNKLNDVRAFRCCNTKCKISLTCTNWKNPEGKRIYFVPSHNDELHVIGCDEVGKKEERQQIEKEKKEIIKEVKNNGIITMMESRDKNTKEVDNVQDTDDTQRNEKLYKYKKGKEYFGKKNERTRAARMETFVDLFKGEKVNKNRKVISAKGQMYSLNELFIPSDRAIDNNIFGIYYGDAKVNVSICKKDIIEITYLNSSFPTIYTNINCLKKINNGDKVNKLIGTNESIMVYFRGYYDNEKNRFTPYNDRYYKDLYFDID